MKKKRFDLQRLAKEAARQLTSKKSSKDVEILIDDLGSCSADRHLMKQVFLNLLENALKFSRLCEHPKIHVGSVGSGTERIYFVRDNGIGFDMVHADAIFLVFQRFHKAQHFEGSGVGLALVKRIIERHDGQIWAESDPDRGATFYFTLDAGNRRRPMLDRRVEKQNPVC